MGSEFPQSPTPELGHQSPSLLQRPPFSEGCARPPGGSGWEPLGVPEAGEASSRGEGLGGPAGRRGLEARGGLTRSRTSVPHEDQDEDEDEDRGGSRPGFSGRSSAAQDNGKAASPLRARPRGRWPVALACGLVAAGGRFCPDVCTGHCTFARLSPHPQQTGRFYFPNPVRNQPPGLSAPTVRHLLCNRPPGPCPPSWEHRWEAP